MRLESTNTNLSKQESKQCRWKKFQLCAWQCNGLKRPVCVCVLLSWPCLMNWNKTFDLLSLVKVTNELPDKNLLISFQDATWYRTVSAVMLYPSSQHSLFKTLTFSTTHHRDVIRLGLHSRRRTAKLNEPVWMVKSISDASQLSHTGMTRPTQHLGLMVFGEGCSVTVFWDLDQAWSTEQMETRVNFNSHR